MSTPPPATRNDRRGIASVELALLLPLLMLILLGTIDFGRIMYESLIVANAARAGAQYGLRHSTDTSGMVTAAQNEAGTLTVDITAQQVCKCSDNSPVACHGNCGGGSPLIYIDVTAQRTFTTLINYPGIPSSVDLSRKAVMRVQ